MSLAKWLRDRLGEPTRGRGCRATKCIVCKADLLAGFDEDAMASLALADPYPLSALGEALALIDGRRTYKLHRHGAGLALTLRSHWNISSAPAGGETIVLAEHRCGAAKLPSVEIPQPIAVQQAIQGLSSDATPPPF